MNHGDIRIVGAPEEAPPFKIDARAVEEDTYLIMGAEPQHVKPADHPLRLIAELSNLTPEIPGSVIIKSGRPALFLAVVHDVDDVPTWREKWIEAALWEIFKKAEDRRMSAIGLPVLGSRYGKFKASRFIHLLNRVLDAGGICHLKRIWLIAPVPVNAQLIKMLGEQRRLKV